MKRFVSFRPFGLAFFLLIFVVLAWLANREYSWAQMMAPLSFPEKTPRVFAPTRQINDVKFDGQNLWVATSGGVLLRDLKGQWIHYTRLNGLPSHEVKRIELQGSRVLAHTPLGIAQANETAEKWRIVAPSPPVPRSAPLQKTTWRGKPIEALHNLKIGVGKNARIVPLPPKGSHVSALLAREDKELLVALYGAGLWSFNGQNWRVLSEENKTARSVTALASDGEKLFIGTRRDGIWQLENARWTPLPMSEAPFDANVQNIESYDGALWVSTLEDGLVRFDGKNWRVLSVPEISSYAPRRTALFDGKMWLQHGNGKLDIFDGKEWKRDVSAKLSRPKIFALASDDKKLYAAQWGGWSEYSGGAWTPFLQIPDLQGLVVMNLLPDGDNLWIGTQSKGIAFYNRAENKVVWHDERSGLPDDWTTVLKKDGATIYAGTFVGGLAEYSEIEKTHWKDAKELRGQNVTAIERNGQGGIFIATRNGLWHREKNGAMEKMNARFPFLENEIQSLHRTPDGLWVGGRTGLYFLPQAAVLSAEK